MSEERAPYHVVQEPAKAAESAHEHLYRVAVGSKTIVRFCERCGQTWLVTELRDILHPGRTAYYWEPVLEEAEAREKLMKADEPLPRA